MLDKSKAFEFSLSNQVNIIGLIFLALFFLVKNPVSKWDKSISGDGKSYYAYLTAAIIYQDLDYNFVEDYESKYYPPDQSLFKEFRQDFKGEILNKTFPGITILWLPFFLLAHFLSYLFGFEPDGYSLLYQYAIGLSAIFYLWLGLKWLSKLLNSLGYANKFILPTLLVLAFGTNLFFYTIHDPSLTHVYNFTLLAGICHFSRRFYLEKSNKWLIVAIAIFAIAIVTRPTNILMIIFLPLVIGNWESIKGFIHEAFSSRKNIFGIVLTILLIGSYPIIWWYVQTDHLIVYSYGEEGFDFSNPHFFQILLSYKKGWLVYSPAILLSILGLISLFKQSKLQFITVLFGFSLLAYIFSCWWIWTYGASFGQRVFVDFYAIIGILIIAGITFIQHSKLAVGLWFVLAFSFIALNQLQTFQFKNGILPTIGATKTTYWDSYFKTKAVRKTYPVSKPHQIIKQLKTDFESNSDWLTTNFKTNTKAYSSKNAQYIDKEMPYSGGFKGQIPAETDFIQISVQLYCESNSASPQLVYELASNANNSVYKAKGLQPYLSKNEWIEFNFIIDLKNQSTTTINTYFWNPTADSFWIDDLEITFGKYD